jgi:protein O-GlcNAc transferase
MNAPLPATPPAGATAEQILDAVSRCFGRGDLREARKIASSAVAAFPTVAMTHHALSIVQLALGDTLGAIVNAQQALLIDPGFTEAERHLEKLNMRRKAIDAALGAHHAVLNDTVIVTADNKPESYLALGRALLGLDEFAMAIISFRRALERREGYGEAFVELGFTFERCDQLHDAVNCFRRAISLDPRNAIAIGALARSLQDSLLWDELKRFRAHQKAVGSTLEGKASVAVERPFANLIASEDPAENRAAAARYARLIRGRTAAIDAKLPQGPARRREGRIRLGYLSHDFRYHPVGQLAAPILARHDRNRFEVTAYSIGPDDGSTERRTVERSVDRFRDLISAADAEIARIVREDEIDILIDLNGYTRGSRSVVMALRPAPIQVWMLGFPGTSGSDFIDYIVADPISLPPEHRPYFSEQPCWLPHSCQTLDNGQSIASADLTRASLGLPSEGPLFVCWQSPFKIDPRIFETWTGILRAVPESHLWLRRCPEFVRNNIAHELRRREIDPNRIVYAVATAHDKPTYLRCLGLADIGLDTFIYNGHATTSDLLWAGVPVVTLLGGHFAGRIAASLLHAAGLPELVTYSPRAYLDVATRLARDAGRRAALKQRLADNRQTAPLFDTALYVRHLERGFEAMMARQQSGEAAAPITIDAAP